MANISISIGSKNGSKFQVDAVRIGSNLLELTTTYNLPACFEGGKPHCFERSTLLVHADNIEDLRKLARDIAAALPPESEVASGTEHLADIGDGDLRKETH
jgi:hypothetical protein